MTLGAVIVGAALVVGCADDDPDGDLDATSTLPPAVTSTATATDPTATDPAPTETATEPAGGETIEATITGGLVEDQMITAGSTIVWTNEDTESHTIVSDDGAIDSGEIAAGGTFEFTFEEAGTWEITVDDAGDTAMITVS